MIQLPKQTQPKQGIQTNDDHTGRLLVGVPEVLMGGCAQRPRAQRPIRSDHGQARVEVSHLMAVLSSPTSSRIAGS